MDVTPQHLREITFKEKMRGYSPDDVDEFLERAANAMEVLQDRLRQANERAARAEQRASDGDDADDAVKRTLVLAQRTADAAIKEAQDEAAQLVADAEARAAGLVEEAETQARVETTEAQTQLRSDIAALEKARTRLKADVDSLSDYHETVRQRMLDILNDQLRRIEEGELTVGPPPVVHEVTVPPEPVYEVDDRPGAGGGELDELEPLDDEVDDDEDVELDELDELDELEDIGDDDAGSETGAFDALADEVDGELGGMDDDADGVRHVDGDERAVAPSGDRAAGGRSRRGMRRRR